MTCVRLCRPGHRRDRRSHKEAGSRRNHAGGAPLAAGSAREVGHGTTEADVPQERRSEPATGRIGLRAGVAARRAHPDPDHRGAAAQLWVSRGDADMVVESSAVVTQEHPVMRWGAVWAGWFVATGIAALLYAFGLAVGFSAFNPQSPEVVARGVSGGAITWMILTWAASLWLGAMFATWFDGRNDTEMGVIRGLAGWGGSVTAATLWVASGLTRLTLAGAGAGGPAECG